MKTTHKCLLILVMVIPALLMGCRAKDKMVAESSDSFPAMLDYIENHVDFVNSPGAPGAIGIDAVVMGNPDRKLIIDLRSAAAFDTGHLAGAIQVPMEQLLLLFEQKVNAASFNTIVLVSGDGQDALFAATLLRILGYGNVFALRLGMGWHVKYADTLWGRHTSSAYQEMIVNTPSPPKGKQPYPVITSSHRHTYDLIRERAASLLSEGYKDYRITAKSLFADPAKYYIINYWPEEEYLLGHIRGAVQYTPRVSLKRTADLGTIPSDRPVVIYCHQGNMSASVTAFLRLLGYDAWSLEFGTNSFMYNHHKEKGIRSLYKADEAIDIPLDDRNGTRKGQSVPPVLVEIRGQGGC